MNEYEKLSRQAERMKENYPSGTRIVLISMEDPFAPVPSGMRGTVNFIDDIGQIHMHWDNGRSLAIVPGEDVFRKLSPEEVETEKSSKLESEKQFVYQSKEQVMDKSSEEDLDEATNGTQNEIQSADADMTMEM